LNPALSRVRLIEGESAGPTISLTAAVLRSSRLEILGQAEQKVVRLCLQLLDAARSDLIVHSVDELFLHFRRQHRRDESLPLGCNRAGELLEEVRDVARGRRGGDFSIMVPMMPRRRPGQNANAATTTAFFASDVVLTRRPESQAPGLGSSEDDDRDSGARSPGATAAVSFYLSTASSESPHWITNQ